MADVRDGLSNTLFIVEHAVTPMRVYPVDGLAGDETIDWGNYVVGNWGGTMATAFYPPNPGRHIAAAARFAQTRAASSLHPGGLYVMMGDGSARFVSETIDTWPSNPVSGAPVGASLTAGMWWTNLPPAGVWQKLASRASGEVVSGDYQAE